MADPWFRNRYVEFLKAHRYVDLAELCEGEGELLLHPWHSEEHPVKIAIGVAKLVEAGHWFRRAGDLTAAHKCGQRVLSEMSKLFPGGRLRSSKLNHDDGFEWYLRELMGDAAVLVDSETARRHYEEALVGYESMTALEHDEQEAQFFPGDYLYEMSCNFLPPLPRGGGYRERIAQKIMAWVDENA